MLRTFLSWLRAAARDAVLAGVSDAAAELAGDGDDPAPALLALRQRLTPALPAPDQADAPARTRKGVSRG